MAAQIVEQPTENEKEEGKPLPSNAPVGKSSTCNCYNILKDTFKDVPLMNQVVASASPEVGNVAVFMYPPTLDFPNGMPHVALVRSVLPDGSLEIEEYNYKRCTHSSRTIPRDYHRLIGFTTL